MAQPRVMAQKQAAGKFLRQRRHDLRGLIGTGVIDHNQRIKKVQIMADHRLDDIGFVFANGQPHQPD